MFQVCRMSSVAAVAAEDAIDHGADNGNTIAGASTIAVAITGAAVVDRAIIIDRSAAAVVTAAAGSDDNTTAAGVASRSTSTASVASRSISATGGAGHRVSAPMSGKGLSAAAMTTWMAGSLRIRRRWHATQRNRGRESDESFFVKHVILLLRFQT